MAVAYTSAELAAWSPGNQHLDGVELGDVAELLASGGQALFRRHSPQFTEMPRELLIQHADCRFPIEMRASWRLRYDIVHAAQRFHIF